MRSKKILLLAFLGCSLLCTRGFSQTELVSPTPAAMLASVARPSIEILPFKWFFSAPEKQLSEEHFEVVKQTGDPLRLTELAYRLMLLGYNEPLHRSAAYARGRQVLDHLIKDYQPAERSDTQLKLKYRFATDKLAPGWWSAMDGFLLPLVLLDAAMVTGEERYRVAAKKAFTSISRPVSDGGSVFRNAKTGCWLSVYTWTNMTQAEEYYVLNGHLYALHALYLYAQQSGEPAAHELFDCALKATESNLPRFRRPTVDWAYYMLTPPTINQTHYVIFEMMQFNSLTSLTGSKIFKSESDYRSRVLQKQHGLVFERLESGQEVGTIFPKTAAPHPYNIDTYSIRLNCFDAVGEKLNPLRQSKGEDVDESGRTRFATVQTATIPEVCTVESLTGDNAIELFSVKPRPVDRNGGRDFPNYKLTAIHDAELREGRLVRIRSSYNASPEDPAHYSNHQGRIIVKDISINAISEIFGIEMFPERAVNIGVGLIDSTGREFFRYYPALRSASQNLVLLSPLGFDGVQEAKLPFTGLNIYVYTPIETVPDFSIGLGEIWTTSDAGVLREKLLRLHKTYIPHDD